MGPATWYALVRLYTAVTRLAELRSQGQKYYAISWEYPNTLRRGDTGTKVEHLQYMLSVLSEFIQEIPPVNVDGIFGPATEAAVRAAQRRFSLAEDGIVGEQTWDAIYDQFAGIENTVLRSGEAFPAIQPRNQPRSRYAATGTMTQFPGMDLRAGNQDTVRQEVVR